MNEEPDWHHTKPPPPPLPQCQHSSRCASGEQTERDNYNWTHSCRRISNPGEQAQNVEVRDDGWCRFPTHTHKPTIHNVWKVSILIKTIPLFAMQNWSITCSVHSVRVVRRAVPEFCSGDDRAAYMCGIVYPSNPPPPYFLGFVEGLIKSQT